MFFKKLKKKIGACSLFTDALSSLISPRIIIGFEISCLFLNCFCFIWAPFPQISFFVLAFIFCIGCSGCLETVCLGLHACVWAQSQNSIWLFATLWTVAHQAPLSVGSSRQEYWSGLPFPSAGDLPDPGIKPRSPGSPTLAGGFFTTEPPGKPHTWAWCEAKGGGG